MKIYIGGISPEVTEKDLWDLYTQYGKVSKVDLLKDSETNINRGYAFITMDNDMECEAAILGTNKTLLGGNPIEVSVSRSRLDQKIERQKKARMRKNNDQRNNFRNHDNKNFNNRNRDNRNDDNHENNYNRYDHSDNNQNNLKKGVDYGRKSSVNGQKTSFLGQEGFARSARTIDPLYSSNNQNQQQRKPFFRNNNKRNYNSYNQKQDSTQRFANKSFIDDSLDNPDSYNN